MDPYTCILLKIFIEFLASWNQVKAWKKKPLPLSVSAEFQDHKKDGS